MFQFSFAGFIRQTIWEDYTQGRGERTRFSRLAAVLENGSYEPVFQPNKNARNKSARQAVQKDNHEVLLRVTIDLKKSTYIPEDILNLQKAILASYDQIKEKSLDGKKREQGTPNWWQGTSWSSINLTISKLYNDLIVLYPARFSQISRYPWILNEKILLYMPL